MTQLHTETKPSVRLLIGACVFTAAFAAVLSHGLVTMARQSTLQHSRQYTGNHAELQTETSQPSVDSQVTTLPPWSGTIRANAALYTVRNGDSLSLISKRFGASVSQLCALNAIKDPDRILTGQQLRFSAEGPGAATHGSIYTVRKGDSLWTIARKAQTSVEALRNANALGSDTIYSGQTLVLPEGKRGAQ